MRTLHLVHTPRLSGAEVLVRDLAIYQRAQGDSVCITALLPEHDDFMSVRAELARNGVSCRFPLRRLRVIGKLWHLLQVILHFQPDVIFAHATIPSFYARALPIAVPIVYVMHSASNDFSCALFRRVERILSWRACAVIGVSQANIEDYVAAVGRHRLMMVIPNGVHMARFAADTSHSGRLQRSPQIVQIGRYSPIKNQLQTIRAFHEVVQHVPDARLVLYGVIEDSAYHAAAIALAESLGIADHVVIGGPCSDVAAVLRNSSVFAMPSRSEGHSIAFLEALASGIPVVASAIDPFAFASRFASVQLVDTEISAAYARALVSALSQPRVDRQLTGLTLADTADRYLRLARLVARG
ncbi:MAG TPA: glycosyltransferase family 4 protein [Trinickia sp.]|jgi:glycosyltransferase involved in cell wall biosynthesis|nr:glycosyltransferase family 4 protein [Trinickia sp.]